MTTNLKIGHYALGKTIGTGASSKVKRKFSSTFYQRVLITTANRLVARHELSNIDVAVKMINKKKMKSANMSSKIKREIRLLRYFNHPNIIRL